ncbi:hypothetical protein KR200_002768, partial [Drosophila serrata]
MRVAREKTKFFKESVEFLGFIVTRGGTKIDPEKVRAIKEFPEPKNLFSLRSFIGLASYYRSFVKNFASIAMSKKVAVRFNETQRNAFDHLRNILASEDVILTYLYGNNEVRIFTDHQPLTYAVSDKNTNAKINRWKAFIGENNGKVFYTPGKQNLVADALSRQPLNNLEAEAQSDAATVHSELSLSYTIETTDKPLNCVKNQIILEEADQPLRRDFIVFGNRTRHIINFNNK